MEKPSKETSEKWRNDPNNWKWGVFYYNPEDKRIFPPKRLGWTGWTINFANKKSVLVFAIILSLIFILTVYLPHKKYHIW